MSKKTLIPKSKAKNAYQLLAEVRALILAEPKRYNQEEWIRRVNPMERPEIFPSCGTICCVGGWVETLRPSAAAETTLGLSHGQEVELFSGEALFRLRSRASEFPATGTQAYAKLGARHITAFMKANAVQLKAKRL